MVNITSSARGTIVLGTGTVGTRIVDKDFPNTEGLSGAITITAEDPTLEELGI